MGISLRYDINSQGAFAHYLLLRTWKNAGNGGLDDSAGAEEFRSQNSSSEMSDFGVHRTGSATPESSSEDSISGLHDGFLSLRPQEVEKPFPVPLEDFYQGGKRRAKISRKLLDGSYEDKIVEIHVLPGYKAGTKIRFPAGGNEQSPGNPPQDLVLVLKEKPHPNFERRVDDLICHFPILLQEAMQPVAIYARTIETLDGRTIQIPRPRGKIQPGQETRIFGEGMPRRKGGKYVGDGDLIVKWLVEFPGWMSIEEKEFAQRKLRE